MSEFYEIQDDAESKSPLSLKLEWIFSGALILNIFPSLIAPSQTLKANFPSLFKWVGPFNPLKFTLPILGLLLLVKWGKVPPRLRWIFMSVMGLNTIFTFWGGLRCGDLGAGFRELAVFCAAFATGLVFWLLEVKKQRAVALAWVGIPVFAGILEFLYPQGINWALHYLFDPGLESDFIWRGKEAHGALIGFWDRGSFGKLLAMTPWIACFHAELFSESRGGYSISKKFFIYSGLFFLTILFILGTTQRGSLIGAGLGLTGFCLHRFRSKGILKVGLLVSVLIGVSIGLSFVILPQSLVASRVSSVFFREGNDTPEARQATESRDVRLRIWKVSLKLAAQEPLGSLCPPKEAFAKEGLDLPYHSHNMILHQFRAKGWIWGTFHLLLWIWAAIGILRLRPGASSFLVGGFFTIFGLGLFDHPWWVLNQAMLIATLLMAGLYAWCDQAKKIANKTPII